MSCADTGDFHNHLLKAVSHRPSDKLRLFVDRSLSMHQQNLKSSYRNSAISVFQFMLVPTRDIHTYAHINAN